MKYIDITRTIFAGMKKYPSDPDVEVSSFKSLGKGNSCNLNRLVMGTHTGTHLDAPRHIFNKGTGVDRILLDSIICRAVVLDLRKISLEEFFKRPLPEGVYGLLMKNSRRGLTLREAQIVLGRKIRLIGTSRRSIEDATDKAHPVHRLLLGNDISIIEGLDLRKAKPGHCTAICLPLKIKNGDGAPVRAVLAYD